MATAADDLHRLLSPRTAAASPQLVAGPVELGPQLLADLDLQLVVAVLHLGGGARADHDRGDRGVTQRLSEG